MLAHHADMPSDDPVSLNTILWMVDYLTYAVDLGFLAEPPTPPQHILELYGCADEICEARSANSFARHLKKKGPCYAWDRATRQWLPSFAEN